MAQAQTAPIGEQFTAKTYPFITAETREMLAQEKLRLQRDQSAGVPPADIHRSEKFIFRAKPGTARMIHHNIDVYPQPEAKNFAFANKIWERNQLRKAGVKADASDDEKKKVVAAARAQVDDLTYRNGGDLIVFNRVRRSNECYYPTNDEVIAAYLRDLVERKVGAFKDVYEVSGNARIIVGDLAFPDTELGLRTAMAYAREHKIDDIKRVSE